MEITTEFVAPPRPPGSEIGVEWALLAPGRAVVARQGDAYLHTFHGDSPFGQPMSGPGSIETTGSLLDGATRAGWAAVQRAPEPPLDLVRWVYRLCCAYHTTHETPPLIRRSAEGFAAAGRTALAEWAIDRADEEIGHDLLASRDLDALGDDPQGLLDAVLPPGAAAINALCREIAESDDPTDMVGFTYAIERASLAVDQAMVREVQSILPEGVDATRCLRVHSNVGADIAHVAETVEVVASLGAEERTQIAKACYETAVLCCQPCEPDAATEALIADWLGSGG